MKDDRLFDDDLDLKAAFRSVRDTYDGENPESNLTLQRALFRTRVGARRTKLTRWVVLPIAAVLAASTAWAGVTGKLSPAVQSMLEAFHAEHAPPPASTALAPVTSPAPVAVASAGEPTPSAVPSAEPAPVEEPASAAPPPQAPVAVVAPPPRATGHVASADRPSAPSSENARTPAMTGHVSDAPSPSATAAADDPHAALFAEAHRLHFKERNPAEALAAWDRYLAVAPNGRFSPEAHYNRALALVRLGRHLEARSELSGFANGTYGSYRRDEAKALLDALARDASAP